MVAKYLLIIIVSAKAYSEINYRKDYFNFIFIQATTTPISETVNHPRNSCDTCCLASGKYGAMVLNAFNFLRLFPIRRIVI